MSDKKGYHIGYIGLRLVQQAIASWPDESWEGWHRYSGERGEKLVSKPSADLPAEIYACLWATEHIVSWPHSTYLSSSFIDHGLYAAGMHWIKPGGCLPRHLDAERHPDYPWRRTHSIVCFLDAMQDGGELVLNDGQQIIQPEAGQVVLFQTQDNWHWVNETKQHRRTLALFAYQPATGEEHWRQRDRALFKQV